jgi:hypothetical protein
MPVFRRVDVVDTTSEALAEGRGETNGALMALGIVVLVAVVMLIGYFAWYAPSQAAAQPNVIERSTTTTTNTTTTPAPAANPPVIIDHQSAPIIVHDPAPAAPPSPSSTDGNTSGNTTGAGTGDDGSKTTGGN